MRSYASNVRPFGHSTIGSLKSSLISLNEATKTYHSG